MNCIYCNKLCQPDGNWWECHHCEVYYTQSQLYGQHIKFERCMNDWAYALNLYPDSQSTVLTGFHRKNINRKHLELKIPHLLQNVNQYNALDKIKFLLLFQ